MRIYKITYELDLYYNDKFNETEEYYEKVFANTLTGAMIKLEKYAAKNYHNFEVQKEKSEEDGETKIHTYQHKNFSIKSCELLVEADI